jgi:hypothetical protein
MALYPSQAWCDARRTAINNDTAVCETGKNWGVDFNGNWLFEVTPGGGLEDTVWIYLVVSAGECHEAHMLADPANVDTGFHVTGCYPDFVQVVNRRFRVQGDVGRIMRNSRFIRAVANTFSAFESEYLDE